MVKLSFILPCHNVEKYIGACLDSLLNQDISHDEYEIICVNDCSTDNTSSILMKYIKIYSNIRIVNHETNRKLGATRNTGREQAKGKYLWFVDGDDLISENVLSNLLALCNNKDLDELFFNFDGVNNKDENVFVNKKFVDSTEVMSGLDFIHKYFNDKLSEISIVWHQLYKTSFLSENNFRSPEVNMGEDGPFAWRTVLNAKRVMSISNVCYHYRVNENSMTAKFKLHPDIDKLFEKTFVFANEVKMLSKEFEIIDNNIAYQLETIAKWSLNSFKTYLIMSFNNKYALSFYKYAKLKSPVIKGQIHLVNHENIGFINSLDRNVFFFLLWWLRETIKSKIKSFKLLR